MNKLTSPLKIFYSKTKSNRPDGRFSEKVLRIKSLRTNVALGFCLIGILLAEVVTTHINVSTGLIFHGVLLLFTLLVSAISHSLEYQRMFLTFSLAPLTRLISLSIPLNDYNLPFWYLIVGVPLIVSSIFITFYSKYRLADIGIVYSPKVSRQLLIGSLGIVLGFIEYQILKPTPLISSLTPENIAAAGFVLIVFTGFLEEFFFRGLMQKSFTDVFGNFLGIILVSLIFAILHIGYKSLLDVIFVFLVALVFGWIAHRSRSIIGISLAHGLTNFFLYLVFPFLFA